MPIVNKALPSPSWRGNMERSLLSKVTFPVLKSLRYITGTYGCSFGDEALPGQSDSPEPSRTIPGGLIAPTSKAQQGYQPPTFKFLAFGFLGMNIVLSSSFLE
jgi:hypothetical protein